MRGVSLTVRAGEIVGVAGVAGNGQRELAEAITGLRPRDAAARLRRRPEALRPATRASRSRAGVAHVPEDRLGTGRRAGLQHRRELGAQVVPRPDVSRGPLLRWRAIRGARAT